MSNRDKRILLAIAGAVGVVMALGVALVVVEWVATFLGLPSVIGTLRDAFDLAS